MVRALALSMFLATACGGPQHPVPTPGAHHRAAPQQQKAYAPMTIKTDAKLPTQALILGTDAAGGSTIVPLAPAPVTVDAASLASMAKLTIAVSPSADGAMHVTADGVPADRAAEAWRAGVWSAALVAAAALGKDPTDYAFTATASADVDGPASAALVAAAFLASLTGDPIDPKTTLAGSVAPDGAIGPADGLPERVTAALAAGKTVIGYPAGQRMAKSSASGQLVDVAQLATAKGAKAVELATIYDAYALLTGIALPQATPLAENELALDAATAKALAASYTDAQKRLAAEWAPLVQLQQAGRLPPTLAAVAQMAQQGGEQAESLRAQGKLPAAYSRALVASVYAAGANRAYGVLSRVQAGDLDGARASLATLSSESDAVQKTLERISHAAPTTLAQHLRVLGAFEATLRGLAYQQVALDAVQATQRVLVSLAGKSKAELGAPAVADQVTAAIVPTALYVERTLVEVSLANAEATIEPGGGAPYSVQIPDAQRLAAVHDALRAATWPYLDRLVMEPYLRAGGGNEGAAFMQVALRESDYLLAIALGTPRSLHPLDALRTSWGEASGAWTLLVLASGAAADRASGMLAAKYGALGAHLDDNGRFDRVAYPGALAAMLASAEKLARANARAAKLATGAVPAQCALSYQLAVVERGGDVDDQISALAGFWTATAFAQMAVTLARN